MGSHAGNPVVAVLNTNDDVVEMLSVRLGQAGFPTVTAHITDIKRGRVDLAELMARHDPRVIVYDIAPPYEENLAFLRLLRESAPVQGRDFVLTTTNVAAVQKAAGDSDFIELHGKPFDLDAVVAAVKKRAGIED